MSENIINNDSDCKSFLRLATTKTKIKPPLKRPKPAPYFSREDRRTPIYGDVNPHEIDRAYDLAREFERARDARLYVQKSGGDREAIENALEHEYAFFVALAQLHDSSGIAQPIVMDAFALHFKAIGVKRWDIADVKQHAQELLHSPLADRLERHMCNVLGISPIIEIWVRRDLLNPDD
jgi:hypothetical protein